jgi:hypothetical protein
MVESRLRGGGKDFHVHFEDFSDCIDVPSEEVVEMLKRSMFVEISDDGTSDAGNSIVLG